MRPELDELVTAYNDAVDRYNLARLEYAMAAERTIAPPVALAMPPEHIERAEAHRPATRSVQEVRDYFESVFEGDVSADTATEAYCLLHDASLDLTRRFFQVSLTRMGISLQGISD